MNKKYLFIHIPKTAGLTIKAGLKRVGLSIPFSSKSRHPHFPLCRYIREEYPINSLFKFCFIRNPIDRFASAFFYLSSGGTFVGGTPVHEEICAYLQNNYKDINDFVSSFSKAEDFVKNRVHFRPQFNFICQRENVGVDFIGTVENLQEDFIFILKKLGIKINGNYATRETRSWGPIKINLTLPHANVCRGRKNYTDMFTPESIDILRSIYAKDFELYKQVLSNRTQLP